MGKGRKNRGNFRKGMVENTPNPAISTAVPGLVTPSNNGADLTKQVPKAEPPSEIEEFIRTASIDVLDKQYRLYSWNDTKTQALITTNSVLFAAVGFLYKDCLRDTLAMILLGTAVLFLGSSLMICLIQVIPRLSSGRTGSEPNTRSLRGISLYETWNAYHTAFVNSTRINIFTDTIRQVYGMACNNVRSIKIIKGGVALTLCGIVTILGAVFTSAIAARGHHAFGSWQIEMADRPVSASVPLSEVVPKTPSVPAVEPTPTPALKSPVQPATSKSRPQSH